MVFEFPSLSICKQHAAPAGRVWAGRAGGYRDAAATAIPVYAASGSRTGGQLSIRPRVRLLQLYLLILMMKRLLLAPFIYMPDSDLAPLTGLVAMGQFCLEAVALAALTGLSWTWARNDR